MMQSITLFSLSTLVLASAALPLLTPRATCSSYVLINARGTGEQQGESSGFVTMNQNVENAVSGGSIVGIASKR